MWAHMVAGDIFATRWIWQNSIKNKDNIWILRLLFFYMLMPLGIAIHLIFSKKETHSFNYEI